MVVLTLTRMTTWFNVSDASSESGFASEQREMNAAQRIYDRHTFLDFLVGWV
jgi:hypothetical protein